ncbi:MAG: transposase [Acidobacteria bacterium]|nr:transposase [Acidobacteriota bacterium]
MERRLQERYVKLVQAQAHVASRVAAGLALQPGTSAPFATTQAAWRFFTNPRVTLPALAEPLRQAARTALADTQVPWALLVHDWCQLGYPRHASKRDRTQLSHSKALGYDLSTALLVRADDGAPIAPLEMHLRTDEMIYSTRPRAPRCDTPHLGQVLPTMRSAKRWELPVPLVHVIDREADAVGYFRAWSAAGQRFLVRADDRRVRWRGAVWLLSAITGQLAQEGAFRAVRDVEFQGQSARQWVAEAAVMLHRPAQRRQQNRVKHARGRKLRLRFVVAHVRDAAGQVLAAWWLLSNVPADQVPPEQLALWYYYRWRIESYFKLLKSAGHHVEQWQQESGAAIARRLLVAAMACVVVWHLERSPSPEAAELRNVLVRLSGRQMKRGKSWTAPALLAGLQTLVAMLHLLEHYELTHLRQLLAANVPIWDTG